MIAEPAVLALVSAEQLRDCADVTLVASDEASGGGEVHHRRLAKLQQLGFEQVRGAQCAVLSAVYWLAVPG